MKKIIYYTALKCSFLLLILLCNNGIAQFSSQGTEFYHGFLQNRTRSDNGEPTHPNMEEIATGFYIANTSTTASTNITIEYLGGTPIVFTNGNSSQTSAIYSMSIAANASEYIDLQSATMISNTMCSPATTVQIHDQRDVQITDNGVIQNKTFRITVAPGDPAITVIAESRQRVSREACLVLPKSSLGNDYYTFTYNPSPILTPTNLCDADYGGPSEIVIVATENNTVIQTDYTGTFSTNAFSTLPTPVSFTAGSPITLQQGEAIQFQSDSDDLTGVHIWGDKPIAVYSGNMAVNINITSNIPGAWDNIMEQMIPTSAWGCTYITAPLLNGISDIYRIVASTNGSSVSINGLAPINVNQSDVLEIREIAPSVTEVRVNGAVISYPFIDLNTAVLIESTGGNIAVAQYGRSAYDNGGNATNNSLDPTMNILVPLNQFINNVSVSVLPRTTQNNPGIKKDYISVVAKTVDATNFTITPAVPPTIGWTAVPGNSAYSYTVYDVSTTSVAVNYKLDMPVGSGFNAYVAGFDNLEGYSYPAGMNLEPVGASSDFIMCVENETTFDELFAYGGANYTWSLVSAPSSNPAIIVTDVLNDINASNPTFIPGVPGVYEFQAEIQTFDGCPFYDYVTVTVENCCFAASDSNYVKYTQSQTFTTNMVWDNKIYIDNNVILTIDGSELDVTNVDVVFGECAGINFINGALLRSNNSVYRPCDYNGTWRGLMFESNAQKTTEGIINECTFKNAVHAILVQKNTIDLRITNNLFSNNKAGVAISSTKFIRSITGNTFITDDEKPDFSTVSCNVNFNNLDAVGILLNKATLTDIIGQNDFIYSDTKSGIITGVYATKSLNIVLNSNLFTNLYQAVNINNSRVLNLESNEFNVSKTYNGYDYRMLLERNINVSIANNSFINSTLQYSNNTPIDQGAIYLNRNRFVRVNNNAVNGFKNGITSFNQQRASIVNNSFNGTEYVGIYSENDARIKIACNTLDLDISSNNDVTGIDLRSNANGPSNTKIISNCITETNYAIHLENQNNGGIPTISNNYLYNYTLVGVENNGFSGNIGSSPSPSAGAGRNSFITNNGLGLTADIISLSPLTSYGNFGVNFISGNISLAGNNVNSTATCGNQIDMSNSSIGEIESCDAQNNLFVKILSQNNHLHSDFANHVSALSVQDMLEVMYMLKSVNNQSDFETFATSASDVISNTNDEKWFTYNFYMLNDDYQNALTVLNSIEVDSNDELYEEILLEKYNLTEDLSLLSSLTAIANENGINSEIANNVLVSTNQFSAYRFIPTKPKNHLSVSNLKKVEENTISAYPNPTSGIVNLEYSIAAVTDATIQVLDVTGKLLKTIVVDREHQSLELNLSNFDSGVYFIAIKSNAEVLNQIKLIKY